MTNFQIIADVMLATYLMNFISGVVGRWTGKLRIWADIIFGIILLISVLAANSN